MIVTVVLEHRFDRTPDGSIWTRSQFPLAFWSRYLEVFDSVRVVARVRDLPAPEAGAVRADGEGVEFAAITHYIGPSDYVAWQNDNKVCFVRMEWRGFGDVPMNLELRLSVEDSKFCMSMAFATVTCEPFSTEPPSTAAHSSPLSVFSRK